MYSFEEQKPQRFLVLCRGDPSPKKSKKRSPRFVRHGAHNPRTAQRAISRRMVESFEEPTATLITAVHRLIAYPLYFLSAPSRGVLLHLNAIYVGHLFI